MTTMALIALLGVMALAILYVFFLGQRASRSAAVRESVEAEVAAKLRQHQEANTNLVEHIVGGVPVDTALGDYQKVVGAILTPDRATEPWNWNADDVERWKRTELHRRSEEVNRRLLLPAIGSSLLIVALTIVAATVYYNFMSSRQALTSSQAPATAAAVSGALPTPPRGSGQQLPADVGGAAPFQVFESNQSDEFGSEQQPIRSGLPGTHSDAQSSNGARRQQQNSRPLPKPTASAEGEHNP